MDIDSRKTEIQEKLLAIITGFSFQKPVTGSTPPSENSEASVKETKLAVPLNSNKRKLYDDYLAQTLSHQVSVSRLDLIQPTKEETRR